MSRIVKMALLGVALVLSIIWAGNRFAAKHGGDSEKLKQAIHETEQGEKTLARVDTVYKLDTIRLTHEVTKYRAFRDTLKITDTVQVKEFVRQSDSTIKACLMTVQTCEQKDSAHKVIEAGLRKQNEALKQLIPGKMERLIAATKYIAIGAVVGVALSHR